MDESELDRKDATIDRRRVLRHGAVAAGAVWATPGVVQVARAAAGPAAGTPPTPGPAAGVCPEVQGCASTYLVKGNKTTPCLDSTEFPCGTLQPSAANGCSTGALTVEQQTPDGVQLLKLKTQLGYRFRCGFAYCVEKGGSQLASCGGPIVPSGVNPDGSTNLSVPQCNPATHETQYVMNFCL